MSELDDADKGVFARREEVTLAFWNEHRIFEKTLKKHAPMGEFVFYDGPPFATGTPHYGHLLQSVVKDAVPRYRTMQGFRVERQWGWDCHGLPIENIVEKELGTKSKKDILAIGVKKFNDLCRDRIFTFIGEWERIIPRLGRWADMEHPYRTMDFTYMESEWWAFKSLYEKGLIYEDYRAMHVCPRCETTLSQGEVADGYKDIKDLSVTVKFKVKNPEKIEYTQDSPVYLLAWTTTPWTLPGNAALAVGKDIDYVLVRSGRRTEVSLGDHLPLVDEFPGSTYIVAKQYAETILNKVGGEVIKELKGSDLLGLEYKPLFGYYAKDEKLKNRENGWKVYAADFVTTDAGTGIVHIAPAFGADDMALGKEKNLPFLQHVKMDGTFRPEIDDFPGFDLKPRAKNRPDEIREADLEIVRFLETKGLVFVSEKFEHSYPHCWRCDTALLNYATNSWFVAVEKIKDALLNNAKNIQWSPAHIKEGRFGQWLAGARDWSISRQRFWANTIPVWRCEQCKKDQVLGSAKELAEASGITVTDLHKDIVDEITLKCAACGGCSKRVPDVLDTWFDSGSVPFAALHYPFENDAKFKARMPADFIGEAQDQTRAWFYYQHVLAGALFEAHAFKNVIVTGLVLAEDGKKMAKKLKNYPDPQLMLDKYGADAMRFYLISSPIVQAENLNFSERGVDEIVKKHIGRLNNVLAFYELYADGTTRGKSSTHILDSWIISRLQQVISESTDGYERYALDEAVRPLGGFIDDLSVWYLRRSRDRFKGDDVTDKQAALATMRYVLHTLARTMAPVMPFMAENIFQSVREDEDEESVHLAAWPDSYGMHGNPDVLPVMEQVRRIVSMALEARDKAGVKVRQPLSSLTIEGSVPAEEFAALIRDEINVKEILSGAQLVLDTVITPTLREEGLVREFVRYVQSKRKDMMLVPSDEVRLFVPEKDIICQNEAMLKKALNAREIVYTPAWHDTPLIFGEDKILIGVERYV